jgi:hypothetical protein
MFWTRIVVPSREKAIPCDLRPIGAWANLTGLKPSNRYSSS